MALRTPVRHSLRLYVLKERKKETKLRDVTSHIFCPDHTRCAIPIQVVLWGGVPDVVNHAKFHQNRFRSFGSDGWKSAIFLCIAL